MIFHRRLVFFQPGTLEPPAVAGPVVKGEGRSMAIKLAEGEGSRRTVAVQAVAILGLIAAAGYLVLGRGADAVEQLDTPESATPYYCLKCQHVWTLTPAKLDELIKAGGVKADERPGHSGYSLLKCPKCGEFAGVRAFTCPNDGTVVPGRTDTTRPGRCPKCDWTPRGS